MIADFYELALPFCDNPAENSDWSMRSTGTKAYFLLNHTRQLGILMNHENADFYFDSEIECHKHAAAYYTLHGVTYPYLDNWIAAGKWEDTHAPVTLVCSKVMVFK